MKDRYRQHKKQVTKIVCQTILEQTFLESASKKDIEVLYFSQIGPFCETETIDDRYFHMTYVGSILHYLRGICNRIKKIQHFDRNLG